MGARDKLTEAQMEAIVNQICILMLRGIVRRADIFQNIAKMDALSEAEQKQRGWVKVGTKSDRMIDEYIARAKDHFCELNKEHRDTIRALYAAQLEELFKKAVQEGKLQTANNIMKNKIFLQGLGGFNVNGMFNVGTFDIPLSPEEETDYKNRMADFYGDGLFKPDKDKGKEGK